MAESRKRILPLVALVLSVAGVRCLEGQEVPDTTRVTISGTVVDFSTLDSIPGVEISLPDLDLVQVTDSVGGFLFEGIYLGIHEMILSKEEYITNRGRLTVAKDGSFVVHMRPEGSPEPGSLRGRVTDPSSGAPVETAMLTLRGTTLQRMTNSDGRFGFAEVPPGKHVLEVEHIGYASRADSLHVFSGRATEVEIPLAVQPIEMEPITVVARSKWMENNGFYRRMGGEYRGKQWTAEEIQESDVTHLGDLLEEVDGIRMAWDGAEGLSILSILPRYGDMRGWCTMPLHIDGVPMTNIDLDMVIPGKVEGLEVYHGISAPIEYSYDYPCGVILVWTR